MSLDPNELEQIIQIREGVARIEVHIERMDFETTEKFEAVHRRIDRTQESAKLSGIKGGATAGGIIGVIISSLLGYFGVGR